MGNIFLHESSEFLCPSCKNGHLYYRDHCRRLIRYEGGDKEWIHIPRHACDNCKRIHRMLPDIALPFKQYSESVISDSITEKIVPETSDFRSSETTVRRWNHWMMHNSLNIDGHLKSIGHRVLGFSGELLRSSISLLKYMQSSMPDEWLKTIIRCIYNTGAFLASCYE